MHAKYQLIPLWALLVWVVLPLGAEAQTDVYGCTNPLALNYNPEATVDDGSCLGVGCPDPNALNFDPFTVLFPGAGDWDVCEYGEEAVWGCTDPQADNYDPSATLDDGSCTYSDLPGCTDPSALNYNPMATEDDGSCQFLGCPDPAALNYDPLTAIFGTGDASVCEYPDGAPGCTDPNALNYDPDAGYDDGSCTYAEVLGCTNPFAWNYNPLATVDDGSCSGTGDPFGLSGCADPMASNFNPLFFLFGTGANYDDCVYDDEPVVVEGCTDPAAANFNPLAAVDNGTCIFVGTGCTDPNALNYDGQAVMDDGSCLYGEDVMDATEWEGLTTEWLGDTDDGQQTYRLYATFNDLSVELTTVFGMAGAPVTVSSDEGPFYQSEFGATFADDLTGGVDGTEALGDTWLTIGSGDDLTYVGDAIDGFVEDGAPLVISSEVGGAWFRVPGSGDAGTPDAEGRVLLGQFTASGTVSATLNLQYFDGEGMPHQVHGAYATWPTSTDGGSGSNDEGSTEGCLGDLDGDGLVSVQDLLLLIAQFGNVCE